MNNIEPEKESETLEEAIDNYVNKSTQRGREYGLCSNAFTAGANWQKEQDRELISELSETLSNLLVVTKGTREWIDVKRTAKILIEKANQYLNT